MVVTQKRIFIGIGIFSVLLAHFFITLGRDELFLELIFQRWYFIDLFFVSSICSIVLSLLTWLNFKIGNKFPLKENLQNRILFQFIIGVGLPSLVCIVFTFLYFTFILNQQISDTLFLVYEFPVAIIVIAFVNVILLLLDSIRNERRDRITLYGPGIKKTIMVSSGDQMISLPVSKISIITKRGNYSFVLTNEGNEYLKPESLNELYEELDNNNMFFRANRQYILSKPVCKSYTTDRSGKLQLTLTIPKVGKITISQRKGPQFKKWLASNNSSVLRE